MCVHNPIRAYIGCPDDSLPSKRCSLTFASRLPSDYFGTQSWNFQLGMTLRLLPTLHDSPTHAPGAAMNHISWKSSLSLTLLAQWPVVQIVRQRNVRARTWRSGKRVANSSSRKRNSWADGWTESGSKPVVSRSIKEVESRSRNLIKLNAPANDHQQKTMHELFPFLASPFCWIANDLRMDTIWGKRNCTKHFWIANLFAVEPR